MKIVIKAGDKFLYKSPYGGLVRGEIGGVLQRTVVDTVNFAYKIKWSIRSTNNVLYELDEIEIVDRWMTEEDARQWVHACKVLKEKKQEMQHKFSRK